MIKLFSEEVTPTFTNLDHNIITVKNYEEVFFDVFEFEINGTTYIAEKQTTYEGDPVVSIPVLDGECKKDVPFVLKTGEIEVLYNSSITGTPIERSTVTESIAEPDIDIIPEPVVEPQVDIIEEYEQDLFEEIELAKALAEDEEYNIQLFNERVTPTVTNLDHNIITVEDFKEVFFDVYEFEINGATYIAEKQTEYKGNPVVSIPIVDGERREDIPFVLRKGEAGILYNSSITGPSTEQTPINESVADIINDPVHEPVEEPSIDITEEYKKDLFEEVEHAKTLAEEYAERVKIQKISEANKSIQDKKRDIQLFFEDSKIDLLQELDKAILDSRSDIASYNAEKQQVFKEQLTTHVDGKFDKFLSDNNNRVKEITSKLSDKINSIVDNLVETQITSTLSDTVNECKNQLIKVSETVNNTLNETEQRVLNQINVELEDSRKHTADVETVIAEQNVELNDKLKKGIDKALGRVGNIKIALQQLENELNDKVNVASAQLKDLCEHTIEDLGNKVENKVSNRINDNKEYINKVREDIHTENKDYIDKVSHDFNTKNKDLEHKIEETVEKSKDYIDKVKTNIRKQTKLLDENIKVLDESVKGTVEQRDKLITNVKDNIDTLSKKVSDDLKVSAKEIKSLKSKNTQNISKLNKDIGKLGVSIDEKLNNKTNFFEEQVQSIEESVVELRGDINSTSNFVEKQVQSVEESVSTLQGDINSSVKTVDILESRVFSKLESINTGIREYYDERIESVENNVKVLNEDQKKYFIDLIEESKKTLLEQIDKDKEQFKAVIINEAANLQETSETGDTNNYVDKVKIDKSQLNESILRNELENTINNKFTAEISSLKRLIEMSSGGGSVAVQFANGGTMNGDLTVVGSLSANTYLGLPSTGGGLPLTGGTITGDLNVVSGSLSAVTYKGITKTMVGLSAVDNTSDANKPVSTAQQAAIDAKSSIASIATVTSTPHTPSAVNSVLLVDDDTIGGAAVVILPAATGNSGIEFTVKKLGNTGTVSVSGRVGNTVDGQTFQSIGTKFDSIKVITNGSNWFVISDNVTSALQLE